MNPAAGCRQRPFPPFLDFLAYRRRSFLIFVEQHVENNIPTDKGKPVERRGRKVTGLPLQESHDSRAAEEGVFFWPFFVIRQ
jgi:hypothetical protein